MRLTYRRDDERRRIEIVSDGPFDPDVFIDVLHRQCREGTWHYAMLSDARRITGIPTFDDLERVQAEELNCGPYGGPLAVIVTEENLFRRACAYAVLAGPHRPVNVVHDRTEAERWLMDQGF